MSATFNFYKNLFPRNILHIANVLGVRSLSQWFLLLQKVFFPERIILRVRSIYYWVDGLCFRWIFHQIIVNRISSHFFARIMFL